MKLSGSRKTVLLIFIFFLCCSSQAQESKQEYTSANLSINPQSSGFDEDWRWVHFTTESGLPSNQVRQVYEATDGTIWVSTTEGVAWFDGFEWRAISFPQSNVKLAKGFAIVGEYHNKLVLVSTQITLLTDKNETAVFPLGHVDGIVSLSQDSLCVLIDDTLYLYTNGVMNGNIPDFQSFHGKNISLTLSVGKYMSCNTGSYLWKNGRWQKREVKGFPKIRFLWIAENENGVGIANVSLGYNVQGLYQWDSQHPPQRRPGIFQEDVRSLDVAPNGDAIVVYRSEVIQMRVQDDWSSFTLKHGDVNNITYVRFRSNGDLFVATTNGLYVYYRSLPRWTLWQHPPPDARNSINEIMKASDGSVWSGTSGGLEIHNNDGTIQTVSSIFNTPLGVITGIAEDNERNIWISSGASFDGAYRWDRKEWKHFAISADSANGLRFHKIKKDKNGSLWFLGLGKSSMEYDTRGNVYLYKEGMFIPWGNEHGFNGERVYSFSEGKNGERWFGTWKGLYRWRPSKNEHQQDGTWTHWTTQQGLLQNRLFTLVCDGEGKVWFGHGMHTDIGLGFVDSKDSVHYYRKSDGLVNNFVWDIAVDSSGKVWIATLGGLSCYDHGEWLTFNERSGLPLERLWPIHPIENKVYVGTQGRGVAILNVDETITPVPRLRLEQPVVEAGKVFIQWKPLAHEGELDPKEILTRYRLDADTWSEWSLLHAITYNDVQSGEHILIVQAKGLFGQYSKAGQSVKFTVIPLFMLRPLFYIPTSGLFIGLISLLFIMHSRKVRHRKEIARSEEKFRNVTETTSSGIIVYDDDLNIIFVNTGAEKLTGYKKEQLVNMKFSGLIHDDHIKRFLHEEGVRKGDTTVPHRGELKMFNRSGGLLWVDMTRGWMRFQDGFHTIATANDITERKRAEEALRESKERYKIITSLISDYAYLDKVEENGWISIVWMTDSFTRLTGYTIDEAGAPDFMQRYIHPEDREITMKYFIDLLSGKPIHQEGRAMTKEGKILWLYNVAFPVVDKATGKVTHIYGAAHDITERKQKEGELHKLSSELVQTEQRERQHLSSFLHDNIGQSLVLSKMKLESVILSLAGKKESEEIQEAVLALQRAIADTRTATFELYPPTLTESGLDHAVRWLIQKMEAQHHLHISIEQTDECVLPEETKTILFNCVRESFLNIVKHARATNVCVRLQNHGEMFRLIIRDDGVGFDIAQLERRAETTSFGLFNLKQQLLHLHGTLEIESKQGRGTSIIVSVPVQK